MKTIIISKKPISHIDILGDLRSLIVHLDIDYLENPSDKDKLAINLTAKIISPKQNLNLLGQLGLAISHSNKFILVLQNLSDINIFNCLALGVKSSPALVSLRKEGFQHTILMPLKALYDQGYLNDETYKSAKDFVNEKLADIRDKEQKLKTKNADILSEIEFIQSSATSIHQIPSIPVQRTLITFGKIQFGNGNLAWAGQDLFCLLLNEGAIDDLLNDLTDKNFRDEQVIQALMDFQKLVKAFVEKHDKEIEAILEKSIVQADSDLKALYHEYQIRKDAPASGKSENMYYARDVVLGPDIRFYAKDSKAKLKAAQQVKNILKGVEISDEDMANSPFGLGYLVGKRMGGSR